MPAHEPPQPVRPDEIEGLRKEYENKEGDFFALLAKTMRNWQAGLFVQAKAGSPSEEPQDNLALERWFRLPKRHQRKINGRRHAGVRIVQEGPTLLLTLEAHQSQPGPFSAEDLLPYRDAQEPPAQTQALQRRKIMRKARSKKNASC